MDDSLQSSDQPRETGEAPASTERTPREAERALLKSLRDHVTKAVEEIVRLRAQNKSLARRLADFESAPGVPLPMLENEGDVSELKAKIASFVTSIDTYLGESDDR